MGWVAAALAIAGAAVESQGAKAEADAQTAAAKYNARVSMIQAREAADSVRSQARVIRGYNVSRVQKSGVRMEGSPLAVLANNAYNAERAAQNAIRTGEAQKTLYLMQGDAARTAGQYGQASAWLRGIGSLAGGTNTGFAQAGYGFSGAPSARAPSGLSSRIAIPQTFNVASRLNAGGY